MTRSELVQRLTQSECKLTLAQAEQSISAILDKIGAALAQGDRVELRGFGVFTTRARDSRVGRNPRTGQPVDVKAKKIPFFKTGKHLRDCLNKR